MLRRLSLLLLLMIPAFAAAPALAQGAGAVVVADVRGPLDQRALDFLEGVVLDEDAQLVVFKIDNPGIASGDPGPLFQAISDSTTPIAAWVGPQGAVAYGGAGRLLDLVSIAGAAPGVRIGYLATPGLASLTAEEEPLADSAVTVTDLNDTALIDLIEPTIGQFLAALDGETVETVSGPVTLETAKEVTAEDGVVIVTSSVEVRFLKPTLLTRFLRLGTRPDAAFFFLVAGLAVAAFEFYAAGAGVAAAVAALSLFLAGYGFATLPMNWGAVVAAVAGVGLYTWDFQRNELGIRSILGTILMFWGGMAFVGGSAQIRTGLGTVLLTVIGVLLFYMFAMTTIVRSRFGTPTIGREHLVGAVGNADSVLDPDGVVVIDGAKWRARAHRATSVNPGDEIEVLAVEGVTLQVVPRKVAKS